MNCFRNPSKAAQLALVAIVALIAAFGPLYHDVFRHYLANPDQDMDVAYHALVLASGQPAEYFEHTGFTLILLYSWVLRVGHFLGLITTIDIDAIVASSPAEFDLAFGQVVSAGRLVSVALAVAMVFVIWGVALRSTGNRPAALAAAILMAGSLGLGLHAVLIHTELLGMLLLLLALLAAIDAARCAGNWRAVGMIAVASLCAMLAVMTKFHLVMLTPAVPFLALFFGDGSRSRPPSARAVVLVVVLALAISLPALSDALAIIARGSRSGYQALFAVAVMAATGIFARLYRISPLWLPPVWAAILSGLSVGYYANFFAPQPWTPWATFNFIEASIALAGTGFAGEAGLSDKLARVVLGIVRDLAPGELVARRYGLGLVYWLGLAGAAALLFQGRRRDALLVGTLIGLAIGYRLFHNLHGYGLRHYYLLLVEPWAILAFAHLLAGFEVTVPDRARAGFRAAAILLCFAIAVSQVRLVIMAPTTGYTQPPDYACKGWKYRVSRIEPQIARFCTSPPPFPNHYVRRPE